MRTEEMHQLPDGELMARLIAEPVGSQGRAAVCEVIVERYSGLVRSVVRRYHDSPEPAEDLIQVGYVGLLKAINNYDPAYGTGLAAYAMPCISGEIKRYFRDKRWQIRVRRRDQELRLQMRPVTEELTQELGRAPDDDELATRLGVTSADILQARQADLAFSTYSLDAPLSDAGDPGLLADLLGCEDPAVEHVTDIEAVNAHLADLPEREQRILTLRFYGNLTQTEIGDRLGISQMHVSRLLDRALSYLRAQLTDQTRSAVSGSSRPLA